VTYTGDM